MNAPIHQEVRELREEFDAYFDKLTSGGEWVEIHDEIANWWLEKMDSQRERLVEDVLAELSKIRGCRYGCYCKLCGLCDEDTSIHCSDCILEKPTRATSSIDSLISLLKASLLAPSEGDKKMS